MADKLQEQMEEIRRNEREKQKMEKKLLQSQINPHFCIIRWIPLSGWSEVKNMMVLGRWSLFWLNFPDLLKSGKDMITLEKNWNMLPAIWPSRIFVSRINLNFMWTQIRNCWNIFAPSYLFSHCWKMLFIMEWMECMRMEKSRSGSMKRMEISKSMCQIMDPVWHRKNRLYHAQ